jgi:hypothetical protein
MADRKRQPATGLSVLTSSPCALKNFVQVDLPLAKRKSSTAAVPNFKNIRNALNHVCLAGALHDEARTEALSRIEQVNPVVRFIGDLRSFSINVHRRRLLEVFSNSLSFSSTTRRILSRPFTQSTNPCQVLLAESVHTVIKMKSRAS